MLTEITKGIKVSVQARYDASSSKPSLGRFVHEYYINIQNLSERTVQLLTRKWIINDGPIVRTVEGDGVIGQQPVLRPDDTHEYKSWCPLTTSVGKMSGHYTMQDMETGELFDVIVPEFGLTATFVSN